MGAKNYAGFSSGPGYASLIKQCNYFVDYPERLSQVLNDLPRNKPKDGKPGYYPDAFYVLTVSTRLSVFSDLTQIVDDMGKLKSHKTKTTHPKKEYLAECEAEWKAYDKMMRDNGQVSEDTPYCPYPFSAQVVDDLVVEVVEGYKSMYGLTDDDVKKVVDSLEPEKN